MDDEPYTTEPTSSEDPRHCTLRQWLRRHAGDGRVHAEGGPWHGRWVLRRELEWRRANNDWGADA